MLNTQTQAAVSSAQVKAGLMILKAVADAIRDLGQVPAGHLYAVMMGRMDLATFEKIIATIVGSRLVEKRGDLLVWVG